MEISMNRLEKGITDSWQRIDRLYDQYAKSKGLTYMTLSVLEAICVLQEDCTQKAICDELHYPKQSVNLIVKNFLQEGYVELKEMPKDRRNKRILLTESGEAYAEMMLSELWKAEDRAVALFSEEECSEFLRLLGIYTDSFEENVVRKIREENGQP